MTADKQQSPRSPTGSFSNSYAHAFVYPGVRSPKSPQHAPTKHPHGPRAQSTESSSSAHHAPALSPSKPDPRDRPGSSRTKFTSELPPLFTSPSQSSSALPVTSVVENAGVDSKTTIAPEPADSADPPYRSPEPVYDPPEEHPPGYVPGVIEEHSLGSDDDFQIKTPPAQPSSPTVARDVKFDVSQWKADVGQGNGYQAMETEQPERPQLGPGMMPRRLAEKIHEHPLYRLSDLRIPLPKTHASHPSASNLLSPTPTGESSAVLPTSPAPVQPQTTGALDLNRIHSKAEVEASLPGGAEGYRDWYFCWQCSCWFRVTFGRASIADGKLQGSNLDWDIPPAGDATNVDARVDPIRGRGFLRDIEQSRITPRTSEAHIHFHEMRSSAVEPADGPLDRVEKAVDSFQHRIPGMEVQSSWLEHPSPRPSARLYLCCGSLASVTVDAGPVAGLLPAALLKAFVQEKVGNPPPGIQNPKEGVKEALRLLVTLLGNPLFKGQRGWVKLDNPRFQAKIGASVKSSVLLYMLGFGCRQEESELRVGPLSLGEGITEDEVRQQDRYMMRAWVELNLFLQGYIKNAGLDPLPEQDVYVETVSIGPDIDNYTEEKYVPGPTPIYAIALGPLVALGITRNDTANTIIAAYEQQKACDAQNLPKYLGALELLSKARFPGADELGFKLSLEKSMGHFSDIDLEQAYARIGYTKEYATAITVEADEAPDDEILKMHRDSTQRAGNPSERAEVSQALKMIGIHRKNSMMERLGGTGQSIMSVDEAFSALSAPRDSIDDGLIMQYEMAVNEYPGKAEHYRSCLQIIADQADGDRSTLKRYLDTGSKEPEIIQRNDIPVGLHNIGNTCYLNSILQYLYSIKPLREAVLSFEQDEQASTHQVKPEVERSKRFVRQLRLLFLQLYKSETSAVRPDEELAYLAITRPEVDQMVQPVEPGSILDSIPTIASPSSTRVNTPARSRPASPTQRSASPTRSSILGKRASQDRESSNSPKDRPKRSDTFANDDLMVLSDSGEAGSGEDFEMVSKPEEPRHQDSTISTTSDTVTVTPAYEELGPPSPTPGMDMESLKLKSPEIETQNPMDAAGQVDANTTVYQPPPGPPPLSPRPRRTSKATLNAGLKFGLQQDSAEVLINVLSQLEVAFEPPLDADGNKGFNLVADLFSCQYRQQLIYQTPDGSFDAQTPVTSVFVHPIIGVEEEGKDLYDCLAELYLGGADIEYEGKKGHMMDLMDSFPPMLYIQMRRSQFDMATGRERKTNTHIPFEQTLSMDRFLAKSDQDKRQKSIELTREMMHLRGRLHALRNQKPLSVPATFDHLRNSLARLQTLDAGLDISDDFLKALATEKDQVQEDIESIQTAIPRLRDKLDSLWTEERTCEYELVSVFMHRGKTSGAGHYWTYQAHLPDHSERFFKYNDELVTEVPASEVLQDRTGSDANPALLCYVRKGKDLVDTLHREVFELEQAKILEDPVERGNKIEDSTTAEPATAAPLAEVDVTSTWIQDATPLAHESQGDIDMRVEDDSDKPLIDLDDAMKPAEDRKAGGDEDDLMA